MRKDWKQGNHDYPPPAGASLNATIKRYKLVPKADYNAAEDNKIKASIDIFQGNYGHNTKYSSYGAFYGGDTVTISWKRLYNAPVRYSINGENYIDLTVYPDNNDEADADGYVTDSFTVTIPSMDGVLSIEMDEYWGSVKDVTVTGNGTTSTSSGSQGTSSGNSGRVPPPPYEKPDWMYVLDEWEGVTVTLPNGNSWESTTGDVNPYDANGNAYLYFIASVTESGVPSGTTVVIDTAADGSKLTSDGDTTLTVTNHVPVSVTINKVDKDGSSLNGASFTLSRQTTDWTVIQTITLTNTSTITIENLFPGRYKLTETQTPAGHAVMKDIYFVINGDGNVYLTDENGTALHLSGNYVTDNGPYQNLAGLNGTTILAKNVPDGSLKIKKVAQVNVNDPAENDSSLIDGTYTFSIDGVDNTVTEGRHYIVAITFAGGVASTYSIDGGNARNVTEDDQSVIVTGLLPGDYTITETDSGLLKFVSVVRADGGGNPNSTTKTITVTVEEDGDTPAPAMTAQVTFTNSRNSQPIKLKKYADNSGNGRTEVKGAEFVIYRLEDYPNGEPLTYESPYLSASASPFFKADKKTMVSGKADLSSSNGNFYEGSIATGTYVIVETKAPDGYQLMQDHVAYMLVTEDATDRKNVKFRYSNEANWSHGNEINNEYYNLLFENIRKPVSLTVNKTDASGSPLSGATFKLYSNSDLAEEHLLATYTNSPFTISTDDSFITPLLATVGKDQSITLYLKETVAPTGYVLSNHTYQIVITKTQTGFTITIDNVAQTINYSVNPATAAFSVPNTPTQLSLKKELAGTYPESSTKLFTFQVALSGAGLAQNQEYNLAWTGTDRPSGVPARLSSIKLSTAETGAGYTAQVPLLAGETATIQALPQGVTYTVTEINHPAGYSETTSQNVTKTGTIDTTPSTVTIVNSYEASPIRYEPKITKTITGNWPEGVQFGFTLAAADTYTDEQLTMPGTLTANATSSAPTAAFNAVTFKTEGTYAFTITENVPEEAVNASGTAYSAASPKTGWFVKDGIAYYATPVNVSVTVTDDNNGALVVSSVSYNDGTAVTGTDISDASGSITNIELTSIHAKKVWTLDDVEMAAWPTGITNVTFQLQQDNGTEGNQNWEAVTTDALGTAINDVTVSNYNTVSFTNLPNDKQYRIVETKVNGQDTNPVIVAQGTGYGTSSDPLTITNPIDTTTVTVTKAWLKSDGSTNAYPPAGTEITLGLYKGDTQETLVSSIKLNGTPDPEGDSVAYPTGNSADNYEDSAWHATWTNLPVYEANGTPITYVVKETTGMSGYTVSYNNSEYQYAHQGRKDRSE